MSILSNNFYYQPLKIDSINTKVYGDFIAKEGDANGRGLLVTLTENGLQKDTTGITLNLKWAHTTVLGLQNLDPFESVDLTKGLYKITYPTDMLRKGKVDAFIQIIDSGKLIGSRNIKINVEATVGDDTAIESSNEFRALASALVEVNGWNDRIEAVEADFIQRANDMEATYPQELLSLGSQLADKVGGTVKAEPEDLSATTLGLVTGTGGPINLLSIPQDLSVTNKKLSADLQKNVTILRDIIYEKQNKTIVPSNVGGTIIDNNTFEIPSTVGSGTHYHFSAIPYVNSKKYKILVTLTNKSQSSVSITPASLRNGSFATYFPNKIIPAVSSLDFILDYTTESSGTLDFRFICYTGNINLQIKYRAFDVTDISDDILSKLDLLAVAETPLAAITALYSKTSEKSEFATEAGAIRKTTRPIACWGDSLTAGYGGGSTTYPSVLQALTEVPVTNLGISGESSLEILIRQGGFKAEVNPFTIPAETTPVEITYKNTKLTVYATPALGKQGTVGLNPVTINGVLGNISYSASKYYFTRLVAGTSVDVTRPTPVLTNSLKTYNEHTQIIFMGTNGGWISTGKGEAYAISALTSQINMMIDPNINASGQYIIIGMHYYYDWVYNNGITRDNVEYALLNKYGRHYINLREYMITYGLADAGITPTQADTDAIALGNVPPSLLYSDGLHGNAAFYTILANLVHKRGIELGHWD